MFGFFEKEVICIDFGTGNTLVSRNGKIERVEATIAVVDKKENEKIIAIGNEAKKWQGRLPINKEAKRPVKAGGMVDDEIAEDFLKEILKGIMRKCSYREVYVAHPAGLNKIQKNSLTAMLMKVCSCNINQIHLVSESMAAAVGAGLHVSENEGCMVAHGGAGTTEVGVFASGGEVLSRSFPVGGDDVTKSIIDLLKAAYRFEIGENYAERLKIEVGSVFDVKDLPETVTVKGTNLASNLPGTVEVSTESIRMAMLGPVSAIVKATFEIFEKCPGEISRDFFENDVVVSGGFALIRGIVELYNNEAHNENGGASVEFRAAEEPLFSTIRGLIKISNETHKIKRTPKEIEEAKEHERNEKAKKAQMPHLTVVRKDHEAAA